MDIKFWMVWNPKNFPPKVRHYQRSDAVAEATRLAAAHPGQQFIVLEAIGAAQHVNVQFNEFEAQPEF